LGQLPEPKACLAWGFPAWGTAQRGRREEGVVAGATTSHSLAGRKLPVLPVTGGECGGARYPGGEWAARALAYVFTISAFKSWKALIRTILKGMLRDIPPPQRGVGRLPDVPRD
jgi:hypothetical protein